MATLGYHIKALRLGYYYLPNASGFMRMIDLASNQKYITETICDFIPPYGDVRLISKSNYPEFLCWWEDLEVIQFSGFLRSLRKIKKPFSVILNEEGRIIRCF